MNFVWDTIMNIEIFAFIGLLIWLYFMPSDLERNQQAKLGDDCREPTRARH